MAVRIRLRRLGKNPKGKPHFRISVFDERRNRDSCFIEELGFYNPVSKAMKVNRERYDYWVSKGALPSATIAAFVKKSGKTEGKGVNMPPGAQINPLLVNLPPLIIIFAIFYFMIIRPQKKQEQERLNMLNKLVKNDEVVTSGGIHGTIVNVKEKTVILRIDENVKMEIDKSAIAVLTKKTQ